MMRAYGLPVRYLLRFLSYLIAAFQMLEPALGNVALPTRRSCRATPPPRKKSRIGEDVPTPEIARILCLRTRPRD